MKRKKALILAGGLGTRLRPLTFAIPKPLIPVRGRPIIDYILSGLLRHGFDDIFVSLNYKADIIKLYLAEFKKKWRNINYFMESSYMGTAGPLSFFKKNGVKLEKNESILIINGDILTDFNLSQFATDHDKARADLSVAMINFSHSLSYGILDLDSDNNVVSIKEKPKFQYKASAGIYLVRNSCLDFVPSKFYTMPELMSDAMKKGLVIKGYLIKQHWLAIEQIKNLEAVSAVKKGDWISKL